MRKIVGLVLVAAALAFLGFAGWRWSGTVWNEDRTYAAQLSDMKDTAVRDMVMLNSVDPSRAQLDMEHWLDISTGTLREALQRDLPAAQAKFAKQQVPTRGEVTAAAVTSFDKDAGKATVLASVRVFLGADSGGAPSSEQRKRFEVGMKRISDGLWKVESLTPVAPGGHL
ncbi:hypothetical protein [Actinomadura oligospora]|uniref:hypothetical protein n=1 Tax=Actinomadura oligospora TaxID=111804 RepID=UPI0004BC78EB|nr:hypothetical protein [Actinomadura oligospora]